MTRDMHGGRVRAALAVALSLALVSLTAIAGCGTAETVHKRAGDDHYNVGLSILRFGYTHTDGSTETVAAAVWYPAAQEPQPYTYETADDYHSRVAFDSPLDAYGMPYPLVFFAHGGYGCGYDSAFFAEYLAARGYVVVAPDFVDTEPPLYGEQIAFGRIWEGSTGSLREVLAVSRRFVEDMDADRDLLLAYLAEHRLHHVSFVLDMIVAESASPSSFLYGAMDEEAIGICGHSLGGITTLGKTGAHPDASFHDQRFKAALLFSSSAYPFEESLDGIAVPMMLLIGDDDPSFMHPELPRRATFDRAPAPRYLAILRNAGHFAFSNSVCGSKPLWKAAEKDPQVNAICRYGYDFMQAHLLGIPAALVELEVPDAAFVYYAWEEQAGNLHEWGEKPPP